MLLGRICGTVWATRKDPRLEGVKFELVQAIEPGGKPLEVYVVAVDSVGAGEGEIVLVAQGSSARQTTATKDRPVDAVIMAIVDRLDRVPDEVMTRDYEDRRRKIEGRLRKYRER
ncbi:MAG: EutN/CcmL family microcompartment protein [Planctomycetes bacterium]|nr:EutN/CcmL family microcompartment protein [Planctomycetota bacterium]